jgi:glycosyltransferase involved in cell wall biosynthesis
MPIVTVLMPVYNGELFLVTAIESILNQSFQDFDFLIIDDGSTDNSLSIIQSFDDNRIKLNQNSKNIGLIATLNKGIDLAKGKYIARMDADDIADEHRLNEQVLFLEKYREVALVGTQCKMIYHPKKLYTQRLNYPTNSKMIHAVSLFRSPFAHPAVMIKAAVLKALKYDTSFYVAEDYHLWIRILKSYPTNNLSQYLLTYRRHSTSESQTKTQAIKKSLQQIYKLILNDFGIQYSNKELETHQKVGLINRRLKIDLDNLIAIEKWLLKLQKHNNFCKYYDVIALEQVISEVWLKSCSRIGVWMGIHYFFKSNLSQKSTVIHSLKVLIIENILTYLKSLK